MRGDQHCLKTGKIKGLAQSSPGPFWWVMNNRPSLISTQRRLFVEGVGLATVPRSTAIHNSCKAHVEGSGTAGTEKEKSGPFSSIRIVLDWRRKHPAIDASGVSRADRACLTVRRAKRLCMTSIPRFADVGSPVLFRRGMCRRDHSNNRQRSCVHRQCEEPYRKFAHASLPLMRKRSWIGSLGRYSYSMLVCCGRMAASALLPRKPARGWQWSRASPR
jgi:hypothetical protein